MRTTPRLPSGAPSRVVLPLLALALSAPVTAAAQAADRPAPAPAGAAPPSAPAAPTAAPVPPPADARRVVHVPESVKAQIREEVREEVLALAQKQGWASPNAIPGWLQRLTLFGDVRGRFERILFPRGNANQRDFPDFAAINAGSPFDVNLRDVSGERYLDVDQSRTRPRLRARLGLDAALATGFAAGLRLASGEGSSPVTTNQTLGGTGGPFAKYQLWLDRAFLRLGSSHSAPSGLSLELGRFENPFFATELAWSDTVNLDGAALRARLRLGDDLGAFLAGGAFPLYTTPIAFPAEQAAKLPSRDKWLFAAQLGAEWRPAADAGLQLGVAFYDYYRVEGRASSPCNTHLRNVTCDTDDTRPLFAQKGNSYMALRTPTDTALVEESLRPLTTARYQYFGLASGFRPLVVTARAELPLPADLRIQLDGEAAWNTAFSRSRVEARSLNNRGPCGADGCVGPFAGGSRAWLGRLELGSRDRSFRWAWSATLGYRHVESDAVLDAFGDPDFGLGGTNLEGYVAGASLVLATRVTLSARWASADAIGGPPYGVDVFQCDLSVRF